jgi:hypothetical protein
MATLGLVLGALAATMLEGCGTPTGAAAKGIGCELARAACAICDAKAPRAATAGGETPAH